MDIAILGGTGDIGAGLALRWAHDTGHGIRIGSRSEEKAAAAGDRYATTLAERGVDASIVCGTNEDVAASADVIVLAVPPYHVRGLLEAVGPVLAPGTVVISPAVGMQRTEAGFVYDPPSTGSLTELLARNAPAEVSVIGAFHSLPAARLADLDDDLGMDTFIVGDDPEAHAVVFELANAIEGLRAVDAGGLACAAAVEACTPLLITAARRADAENDFGFRLV